MLLKLWCDGIVATTTAAEEQDRKDESEEEEEGNYHCGCYLAGRWTSSMVCF
jgi:hypothetical protein